MEYKSPNGRKDREWLAVPPGPLSSKLPSVRQFVDRDHHMSWLHPMTPHKLAIIHIIPVD